jgi:hypothetical protein
MKRLLLAMALLLAPTVGCLNWAFKRNVHQQHIGRALGIAVIFAIVVLSLLELAGRGSTNTQRSAFGYLQVTLGADGRFSTSKTVVAAWTMIFAFSLVVLSAMVWLAHVSADTSFGGDWNPYLLLLGGPFASAVAAKAITVGNITTKSSAKTATTAASGTAAPTATTVTTSPQLSDLVTNDAGDSDLIDTQYMIFTLVAVVYFVGSFISNVLDYANQTKKLPVSGVGLPPIPAALLGLTSLAALTYVGNKATQTTGLPSLAMKPVVLAQAATVPMPSLSASATPLNTVVVCLDSANAAQPVTNMSVNPAAKNVVFTPPQILGDYQISVVAPDITVGPLSLTVK